MAGCIASHQLLDPDHEVMKKNKAYFVDEEATIAPEWLVPRPEAVAYHRRDTYEAKLEKFIQREFVFQEDEKFDFQKTKEDADAYAEVWYTMQLLINWEK